MTVKGTGGDLFPFVAIGTLLKRRGHDVALIHDLEQAFFTRFYTELRRICGLNYVAIDAETQTDLTGNARAPASKRGVRGGTVSPADPNDYEPNQELFAFRVIAEYCRHQATVLIANKDLQLVAQAAAEKFALPLLSIYPTPFHLTSMPMLNDIYRMLAAPVNRFRAAVGLPAISDWEGLLWSSDKYIGLWPAWYAAPDARCPSSLSLVGFLRDYGAEPTGIPQDIAEFIAGAEPPVLITHGTTAPDQPGFFSASVEACRQLGLRAVLVSRYEELIPQPLPEGIIWFNYLSLGNLMPRFRAVIHHGGIGTSAQALAAGIPQLVLGFNYDRPDNGARLQNLGVGRFLPAILWQPHAVADALQNLLVSSAVRKRCEELAGQSNYPDAAALTCDIIENLIAEKTRLGALQQRENNRNADP